MMLLALVRERCGSPPPLRIVLIVLLNVFGMAGQTIALPILLDRLGPNGLPYFVLLFLSTAFGVVFGVTHVACRLACCSRAASFSLRRVAPTGVFDAVNGVLAVYPSGTNRLPATLSTTLGVFGFPVTYALRFGLPRCVPALFGGERLPSVSRTQHVGLAMATLGGLLALVPYAAFQTTHHGTAAQLCLWIAVFMAGVAAASAMNVFTEGALGDAPQNRSTLLRVRDLVYFETVRSWIQTLTMLALHWVDAIPGFGIASSYVGVWQSVANGTMCMFGVNRLDDGGHVVWPCHPAALWPPMIGFAASYMVSYITSDMLTWERDANLATITTGLSIPMTIVFYIVFPTITTVPTKPEVVPWAIASAVFICVGVFMYAAQKRGGVRSDSDDDAAAAAERVDDDDDEETRRLLNNT